MSIMQPYSMRRLIAVAITTVPLLGCIGFLFEKPRPGTDYGEYPERYDEIVVTYVGTTLTVPDSHPFYSPKVELNGYMFKEPRKAYSNEPLIKGGNVIFVGYAVQFSVNVNGPRKAFVALIRDGEVITVVDDESFNPLLHFVE
jgi:hypothetical protein